MNWIVLEIDILYMWLGGGGINILVFIGDVVSIVVLKLWILVRYLLKSIV